MRREKDPYAPPPRHRDSSGAVVRFAIIAALLGAAAWGYMQYAEQPQRTALLEPAVEEQSLAGSAYDASQPAAPDQSAPPATAPGEASQPTPPAGAPPQAPSEPPA
jgi:cytoskeletal protein RodZ